MLLKLLKHEFKSSRSVFLMFYMALICLAVFLRLTQNFTEGGPIPILAILGFLFTCVAIGLIIFCFVYIVMTYIKSMFKKPGYLTLTLPVSPAMHLSAKLIMAVVWVAISVCIGFIAAMISSFEAMFSFSEFSKVASTVGLDKTFLLFIPLIIITLFQSILVIYFCITVVFTKYVKSKRGFIGIGLYAMISVLITFIGDATTPNFNRVIIGELTDEQLNIYISHFNNHLDASIVPTLILAIIIGVSSFIGICYLINHKIELD